jgi:hypothetical protein
MFRVYVLTLDVTCRQMFRLWVLNLKPKHWLPGRRPRVDVVVRRWRQCDVCQESILRASDSRISSASCSWNTLMIQPCFCMAKGYHRSLPTLLIPMKFSWLMKNFLFAITRECHVCPDAREQKNSQNLSKPGVSDSLTQFSYVMRSCGVGWESAIISPNALNQSRLRHFFCIEKFECNRVLIQEVLDDASKLSPQEIRNWCVLLITWWLAFPVWTHISAPKLFSMHEFIIQNYLRKKSDPECPQGTKYQMISSIELHPTSSPMFRLWCFGRFDVSAKQLGKLLWLCSTL